MSPNAKKIYTDAPKYLVAPDDPKLNQLIRDVRSALLEDFAINSELYIEKDLEKLKTCDFEVRRYLFQSNLNPEVAIQMIKDRLVWRKEMDLGNARAERFPIEFYQSGGIFEFMIDNDGDPVLYVRSKFNVRIDVLAKPFRQFLIYHMDLMDQRFSQERCWGLVFDAQGFSWNNVDFDFLHLIIKVLKYYMPWSVKYVIIYEIPWFLESIWKAAQHFIPEDGKRLIRVYNKKTIAEAISLENLPKILGGKSDQNHIKIPENALPATIVGKIELGLTDEDVVKIKKHLAKMDKEIGELISA